MKTTLEHFSIPLLRWTLGLVVIEESLRFAFSTSVAHVLMKMGLPGWIRPVLGGAEALAALLFLLPFTAAFGSYVLLIIFVLAGLLHVLHGQFDVGGLVVYGVVVMVCMAAESKTHKEALHER